MKTNKKNKGFTLIELMVVISIITLLSSVILVSVKDARDKSTATKFRAEIMQLVGALELYKTSVGNYPYEDGGGYTSYMSNDGTETSAGGILMSTLLTQYIKGLPKAPKNSFTPTYSTYQYVIANSPTGVLYKCSGDVGIPKYVILFTITNPTTLNIFSNLPLAEVSTYRPFVGASYTWSLSTSRCFSLK